MPGMVFQRSARRRREPPVEPEPEPDPAAPPGVRARFPVPAHARLEARRAVCPQQLADAKVRAWRPHARGVGVREPCRARIGPRPRPGPLHEKARATRGRRTGRAPCSAARRSVRSRSSGRQVGARAPCGADVRPPSGESNPDGGPVSRRRRPSLARRGSHRPPARWRMPAPAAPNGLLSLTLRVELGVRCGKPDFLGGTQERVIFEAD